VSWWTKIKTQGTRRVASRYAQLMETCQSQILAGCVMLRMATRSLPNSEAGILHRGGMMATEREAPQLTFQPQV